MDATNLINCIKDWQTLIGAVLAAVLALFAAGWAHCGVQKQIKAAQNQEADRLKRRLNAARTLLPLTLAGMSRYACDVANYLMTSDSSRGSSCPKVPDDRVNQIAKVVETTGDKNVIHMLHGMACEVQVLNSRINGLHQISDPSKNYKNDLFLNCLVILAQCNVMRSFARLQQDTVPDNLSWDDVRNAINDMINNNNGIYWLRDYDTDFQEFCGKKEKAGHGPESIK